MIFFYIWLGCIIINILFVGVMIDKLSAEAIRSLLISGLLLGPIWTLLVIGALMGGKLDK